MQLGDQRWERNRMDIAKPRLSVSCMILLKALEDDIGWLCIISLVLCLLTWVCLKIGYIPNYSHLIGIMIITIGFRGTLFSDTPTCLKRTVNSMWNFFGTAASQQSQQAEAVNTATLRGRLPCWRVPSLQRRQHAQEDCMVFFPRRLDTSWQYHSGSKCKKCIKMSPEYRQNGWFGF